MRPATLVGLLLLAVGGLIAFRGFSYSSNRSVLKVGEFEATLEERQTVPTWAGGLVAVAGLVLVAASMRKRG